MHCRVIPLLKTFAFRIPSPLALVDFTSYISGYFSPLHSSLQPTQLVLVSSRYLVVSGPHNFTLLFYCCHIYFLFILSLNVSSLGKPPWCSCVALGFRSSPLLSHRTGPWTWYFLAEWLLVTSDPNACKAPSPQCSFLSE